MISKWMMKAVVQKLISFLPSPEKANYWFQKHVTKGVILSDEHLGFKVRHARDHIRYFQKYRSPSEDARVLELGTGWYPIIPLLLFLTKSSGKTISLDIQNWLTKEGVITAIKGLKSWKESGRLASEFGDVDGDRWQQLEEILLSEDSLTMEVIKSRINLDNRLLDARNTGLEEGSFDLICSNNTFEHIYLEVLSPILEEFDRLMKKGGVMSHFIDMTDHFAHFDRSITVYNFLRFSKRTWRLVDNSIQPQSRARFVDYIKLYQALDIPITETDIWPIDLEALRQVPVHREYASYTENELAIQHGYIVSQY